VCPAHEQPGTTGLRVHCEFNAGRAFQHSPSPILTRPRGAKSKPLGQHPIRFRPQAPPFTFRATSMREFCTSGSLGGQGGQPLGSARHRINSPVPGTVLRFTVRSRHPVRYASQRATNSSMHRCHSNRCHESVQSVPRTELSNRCHVPNCRIVSACVRFARQADLQIGATYKSVPRTELSNCQRLCEIRSSS